MIWVTPRAVSPSPAVPPMKSGSPIGIGWKLPWLTSSCTTAAAKRGDSVNPPASAPSASARRRVTRRSSGRESSISSALLRSATEQLVVEFDLNVFPQVIVLGPEHGERPPA